MQDIHQIKFTEKDDDDENDDDQKESEKCELIENRKDSESQDLLNFVADFGGNCTAPITDKSATLPSRVVTQ